VYCAEISFYMWYRWVGVRVEVRVRGKVRELSVGALGAVGCCAGVLWVL
jgi:hypothetical protein